jgi:xanthosine utilization system XapX-like protein
MTIMNKLKIFSSVILFFICLSLTARELILSDLYLDSGKFWSVSLIFGLLVSLLFIIYFLKKDQTALDRFRIIALLGIAGFVSGPGVFGGINRLFSEEVMHKSFIVRRVTPMVEGRGLIQDNLEKPDSYKLNLETEQGFLELTLPSDDLMPTLKSGDNIELTVCNGLLGFRFFDNESLQKI